MKYKVVAWLNDTRGHRFDHYEPGDQFSSQEVLFIEALEGDFHGALDRAWAVGNRIIRDANDQAWPASKRSLSVGDLLTIEVNPGRNPSPSWAWAIEPMGFKAVPQGVPDCIHMGGATQVGFEGPVTCNACGALVRNPEPGEQHPLATMSSMWWSA